MILYSLSFNTALILMDILIAYFDVLSLPLQPTFISEESSTMKPLTYRLPLMRSVIKVIDSNISLKKEMML